MSVTYDAGIATSYAAAVAGGYTGTKEQYYAEQAQFAINAQRVAQDRTAVEQAVTTFSTTTAPEAIQDVTDEGDTQVQRVKETGDEYLEDIDSRIDDAVADLKEDFQQIANSTEITDTASGSIASFPDGADDAPMKSVIVTMEPIQDLHGYDNPWPAGGGANQFDAISWATLGYNSRYYTVDSNEVITVTADDAGGIGERLFDIAAGEQYSYLSTFAIAPRIFDSGSGTIAQTSSGTFTAPSDGKIAVKFYASTYPTTGKFILVKGSTVPSAWSPYSNICPISGRTGVTVTTASYNLFDPSTRTTGAYVKAAGSGSPPVGDVVTYTGWDCSGYIPVKPSTQYTQTLPVFAGAGAAGLVFYSTPNVSGAISGVSTNAQESNTFTFVTPSNCRFIRFSWSNNFTQDSVDYKWPQIEEGAQTAYKPYAGTTIPVTFPTEAGTVYGGTVDVVRGDGENNRIGKTFDGSETWRRWQDCSGGSWFVYDLSNSERAAQVAFESNVSSHFAAINSNTASTSTPVGKFAVSTTWIGVTVAFSTVDDFKTWLSAQNIAGTPVQISYVRNTVETFTVDPNTLSSLYGQNNVWSDADSVSVEYTADTKLYISKAISAAVAALA